jgi:peroxiredoxin/glutaredoxin
MKIKTTQIPEFTFKTINNGNWKNISSSEIFKNKKIIILALPGAFTPTCSTSHLPRYDELYKTFISEGIDDVYCLSVNDTFVMNAWLSELGIKNIKALPDGTGAFTNMLGMLVNKDDLGFGHRSWRYSMIVNNGVVEKTFIEKEVEGDPFDVSDADTMLNYINPESVKPVSYTLLTREGCPHCVHAKSYLDKHGIIYHELSKNKEGINAVILRGLTGNSTYPQLLKEGQTIGGNEDIIKYFS